MFKTCESSFLGYGCIHKSTVEDYREGTVVCIDCGLVVDDKLMSVGPIVKSKMLESEKMREDQLSNYLADIVANNMIPTYIIPVTINYFKCVKNKLNNGGKRFPDKIIIAYALYESLHSEGIPRTAQEIAYFSNCPASKLWDIESILNLNQSLGNPVNYIERYCTLLGLKYSDTKLVKSRVEKMNQVARPQCLAALALYLYCKENQLKISLKTICDVCAVSTTNIHAMLRRKNKTSI